MTVVLAVDPGPTESGFVLYDGRRVLRSGVLPNPELLGRLRTTVPFADGRSPAADLLAIEMITSYGMPVGREVFETCIWVGRFLQTWPRPDEVRLVPRRDVKLHLCESARAKDPHIWQALLDRFGPVGTKASPGRLYGVRSHARAALALAVTVGDQMEAA